MTGAVDWLFYGLACAAVVTGWRVFRTWSMARASFLLLASFLSVAGVLLLLASEFLGAITVLMMTGEMVIMAVFMVMMMMNSAGLVRMQMGSKFRAPVLVSVGAFLLLAGVALATDWPVRGAVPPPDVTVQIGLGMMGPQMLAFLVAGVVLLVTIVVSLALALPRGRYDRYGDELDRAEPADPIRGGVGR